MRPRRLGLALIAVVACSPGRDADDPVAARVDGESIYRSEVEARAGYSLQRARLGVHAVLARETERLIDERLLQQAAEARGLAPEALLREAEAEAEPVSEADVDRYLAQHPGEAAAERARPRIRYYLEETRRIECRLALRRALRSAARIEVLLSPPKTPRIELSLAGAPSRGPVDATVTIVHFADLRAAASARTARTLAGLQREFPGRIRLIHRNLPRERDELGLRTAQLAAAAQREGVFWTLHDRLVAEGGVHDAAELDAIATSLRLPASGDADTLLRVKQDLDQARALGVERAPTLFVNGRYYMGLYGETALRALVLEELEG